VARLGPYDFRRVRRALVAEFGRDTILGLHRHVPLLDRGTLVLHWALLFALVGVLGTLPPLSLPWILCFLFFRDAGDCHLVHHIFPNIPFYKVGKAADLFHPFLLRQGVRERRSLLALLWGYFARVEPHRALWST